MAPYIPGIVFIVLGVLLFAFKVPVIYSAGDGSSGGAPILDAVIFPPMLMTFGVLYIGMVQQQLHGSFPFWALPLCWILLTTVAWFIHKAVFARGNYAAERLRKQPEQAPPPPPLPR